MVPCATPYGREDLSPWMTVKPVRYHVVTSFW